jgi:hypothetical protein
MFNFADTQVGCLAAIHIPVKTATVPATRYQLNASSSSTAPTNDALMGLIAIETATNVGVVRSSAPLSLF